MGRGVVCSTFPCVLGPWLGRAWRDVILMRRSPSLFSILLSSSARSLFCHLRALSSFLVTWLWLRSFPKQSCSLKPILPALLLPRIFAGKRWRLTISSFDFTDRACCFAWFCSCPDSYAHTAPAHHRFSTIPRIAGRVAWPAVAVVGPARPPFRAGFAARWTAFIAMWIDTNDGACQKYSPFEKSS